MKYRGKILHGLAIMFCIFGVLELLAADYVNSREAFLWAWIMCFSIEANHKSACRLL